MKNAEQDSSEATLNFITKEALLSGAEHALKIARSSVEDAIKILHEARLQLSQKAIVSERNIGNLPKRKGGYFQEAKDQE